MGYGGRVMKTGCAKWFLKTAAFVLLTASVAKLISAFGATPTLYHNDPITGLSFDKLFLVVGVVELGSAVLCLSDVIGTCPKLGLVAWLSTNFLVYRLGLWFIGWHRPCGCMGGLAAVFRLSDKTADDIMKGLLAYMLIGSYAGLFWFAKQRREVGIGLPPPPAPR